MDHADVETILTGHDSPETAYVIEDYPYGRRLRCRKRVWVETATKGAKKGQQRVASQTTNPKRAGEVWNKPKRGTYSDIVVLYLDTSGHVQGAGASAYSGEELAAFHATFGDSLTEHQLAQYRLLLALTRVGERLTYKVVEAHETPEEVERRRAGERRTIGRAVAVEHARILGEAE